MKLKAILLFSILSSSLIQARTKNTSLTYHIESGATTGAVHILHFSSQVTDMDWAVQIPIQDTCWQESLTVNNFNTDGVLKLD